MPGRFRRVKAEQAAKELGWGVGVGGWGPVRQGGLGSAAQMSFGNMIDVFEWVYMASREVAEPSGAAGSMWWSLWLVVVALVLPGLGDDAAPDLPQLLAALPQLLAACPPRGGSVIAACVSCINAHHLPTSCSQRELFALCRSHAGGRRQTRRPAPLPATVRGAEC
eukprot:COSAG04_NODE_318_length_16973_cov_3.695034_12_plen_166_part_00